MITTGGTAPPTNLNPSLSPAMATRTKTKKSTTPAPVETNPMAMEPGDYADDQAPLEEQTTPAEDVEDVEEAEAPRITLEPFRITALTITGLSAEALGQVYTEFDGDRVWELEPADPHGDLLDLIEGRLSRLNEDELNPEEGEPKVTQLEVMSAPYAD